MINPPISYEELVDRLDYNQLTGKFTWRVSRGRVAAGDAAGTYDCLGYLHIRIDGKKYKAHKIAWFYEYREWPLEVDHRDRNPSNNAIINLRLCTRSQNSSNRRTRSDSSTGLKGVGRAKNKYRAEIRRGEIRRHIGVFDTAEAAHRAYRTESIRMHGEFSVFGEQGADQVEALVGESEE